MSYSLSELAEQIKGFRDQGGQIELDNTFTKKTIEKIIKIRLPVEDLYNSEDPEGVKKIFALFGLVPSDNGTGWTLNDPTPEH